MHVTFSHLFFIIIEASYDLLFQYSVLEKEKKMLEIELKGSQDKHKTELSEKISRILEVVLLEFLVLYDLSSCIMF